MLIYDIFPPERIKKITKEILGIKNYRTKREKILNIGVRFFLFLILSLMILNNFYPFSSLEKAIKKIFAEDLKRVNFYPQTTENQTSTIVFKEFLPEENFDFQKARFNEAKIKIYFSTENSSIPPQETGFLSEIKEFAKIFFQKENKLVLAEEELFSIDNQGFPSEMPSDEETISEQEKVLNESIENDLTNELSSNLETSTSTEFTTSTENQPQNDTEISTTTEPISTNEEKLSLWYNLGDEIWIKLSDISAESKEIEIESQFLKSFDDVLNLSLKIEGEKVSELKIEKVFVEVSFFEIKREEFEIVPLKKVFGVGERPIFEIREKGKEKEGIFEKILGSLKTPSETKIKIENSKREKFELKEEDFLAESHSPVKIEILNVKDLRPGVNKIEVEFELDGQIYNLETNFLWGVLAINTSKSIYLPGETAYFQMAALREDGHTLCDANLELEIETPKGEIIKPEIQKSRECGPNNVTQKPDYFAFLKVNEIGTYKMKLKNLDREWEIEDFFEVREKVPLNIERIGPTRIWPKAKYEMKIKIKANKDFEGEIIERVPLNFEIEGLTNYELRIENNEKEIIWKASLKENEQIELSYKFDAPDISPYLYLLGPLNLKNKKGIFDFEFEEKRQWQIAADSPGKLIKTVEFFIYQYASQTDITSGNGINNLAYSDANDVSFTINLPESGIVVRRAIVEWRTVYLGSAAITAAEMKFRRNGQTNKILTLASATYPIGASSGENVPMVFRMEVSDQIAAGTNTYYFNAQLTGGVRNTDNAKIYITYEYDDNSPVQLKTNKFFVGCRTTNAAAGTNDDYTVNPGIGESSASILQYWIEYYSKRDLGNVATDVGFQVSVNGTAGYTAYLDGANRSNYSTITLHKNAATLNLNSNNTIRLTNTLSATNLKCAELVITYTINALDKSDLYRTNTVVYPIGQLSGDITSTAAPGVSIGTQNIYLPEAPTSSLVIKSVWFRYWQYQDAAHNITLRAVMNGNTLDTTFTTQSNVQEITGPSYILFNLNSFFAQNFNANGTPVEIRVWASVSGAAESPGGELVITYEYPVKVATRSVKTVYWWVGQEANNAHNDDFLDTTLADQPNFSTFIPEPSIEKRASAVKTDYLVLNTGGTNLTRIHRFAIDRVSTPPDCVTASTTRDLASASYLDTGEQNEAPMAGLTQNSMIDSSQDDIKFRFCLDNYTNSPKVVSPFAYTTYEYPLPPIPSFSQKAILFQNDDGENVNENSTSTLPNSTLFAEKGERAIFRVQIENSGIGNAVSIFNLEFATTSQDCTSSLNWLSVSENSEISFSFGLSGKSGDELTQPIVASSSYTWTNGKWFEATSSSDYFLLPGDYYTELAFVIHTANANASTSYCLRLKSNGNEFNEYLNFGKIFVTANPIKRYSKDAMDTLPENNSDLTFYLDHLGYQNVESEDGLFDSIVSSSSIPVFLFAKKNSNNTDVIKITWKGQSTASSSLATTTLEIWNGSFWEKIAFNNTASANTNFTLSGIKMGTNYYDNDNWVYVRVWQEAGNETLKTDLIEITFSQPIEISGKVFVDEGENFSTQGSIVSLVIEGTWFASTTVSASDGSFSFSIFSPATSTPILVYLDDSLEKGLTITKYSGSGDVSNLDIYQNRIILRSDSGEGISISDLDLFDSEQDSDILFTASSSAGTLNASSNSEFFIWPGSTFNAWGEGIGNLSFSDVDIRGTFNATSSQQISISCSGNFSGVSCWQNLGNFNFASSTVKFTSTSTGKIINPGSSGFYNLEFNGQGGSWQFSGSTTIYGNLRITQGTLTGNQDITIKGGNLDCGLTCGEINFTGGTTTIEGTGNFGTSGLNFDWTFYNLVFGDGINFGETQAFGSGTTTILNNLKIENSHTLNAGEKNWILKNSGTPFEILGNFISASSTFSFEGNGTTTIPSIIFYNLKINPSLDNADFVFSGSSTTTNDFSILNGNVFAPPILTVGGNWQNQGKFFHNNGKVIFNATDFGKIIDSGGTTTGKTFYDIDFDGAGGWQIQNDILAERDLKIISAGSFDASTSQLTVEVRGDFKNFVGGNNTQWGNSTLYLNKTGGGKIEVNPKNVSDHYGTLKLGSNVSVLLWNSFAQNFVLEEGAGFYSRNHQGNNGLLYIQGNFEMTTGTEYWSYSKDFDGEEISGRQLIVQIASSSTFTLNGGSLEISGTASYPTIITNDGDGTFGFNLVSGTFSANYYQFRNLDANGLNVTGTVNILSLDNGDFELAVNGGSLITVSPSIIENGRKTFNSIRFATSGIATWGYNVRLTGSPSCSPYSCYWRFQNHYGGLDGENFDFDPGDASPGWLQWEDSEYYNPRSQSWQFFYDYNKETPQEPAAPENFAPTEIAPNTILKLRISIKEISGFGGENIKMRLQYSTSPDFSENVYFVAEKENCHSEDIWCYADGVDEDNATITELLLSDSEFPATHNESGISISTYLHPAGSTAEWEFTIKNNKGEEGVVYYFRAYDNTFNQPVLVNDNYQYPSILAGNSQLSFRIEGLPAGTSTEGVITTIETKPDAINFSNLQANISQIGAHRLQISTNAAFGYQLFVFEDDRLRNEKGQNLQPFPCSNESPCSWNYWKTLGNSSAYGYHTGDDLLAGNSNRFAADDSYACFENTPKEIAYHPFPSSNHFIDFVFRVETKENQFPGYYVNQIIYLLLPTF